MGPSPGPGGPVLYLKGYNTQRSVNEKEREGSDKVQSGEYDTHVVDVERRRE